MSAVGLGAMPLSFADMLDHREQAIATIHRAIDLGVTFIDSANIYAPSADTVGHNEALVCEALSLYFVMGAHQGSRLHVRPAWPRWV